MHTTSARLLLRPPMAADLERLFAIYGNGATNTFNPAGPLPDAKRAATLLDRWRSGWRDRGFGPGQPPSLVYRAVRAAA